MATKDVGLRIRVERSLRERFVKACQADDKPAAQVIREFMRDYVAQNSQNPSAKTNSIRAKEATGGNGDFRKKNR